MMKSAKLPQTVKTLSDGKCQRNVKQYWLRHIIASKIIYLFKKKKKKSLKTETLSGPAEAFLTRGLYTAI